MELGIGRPLHRVWGLDRRDGWALCEGRRSRKVRGGAKGDKVHPSLVFVGQVMIDVEFRSIRSRWISKGSGNYSPKSKAHDGEVPNPSSFLASESDATNGRS